MATNSATMVAGLLADAELRTAASIARETGIPLEDVWPVLGNDDQFKVRKVVVHHDDSRHRDDDGCPLQPLWGL
jgi:hypothetical protein